jgi:hypothetical protein
VPRKLPYGANLIAKFFADEALYQADGVTPCNTNGDRARYWIDTTFAASGAVGARVRDWANGGGTARPTWTAGLSPDGHKPGLAFDGVANGFSIADWVAALGLTEAESFVALKSTAAHGVSAGTPWALGYSGSDVVLPYSDDHCYDNTWYSTRPDMGAIYAQASVGCVFNARVDSANNRTVRVNDAAFFSDSSGTLTLSNSPKTLGENQSASIFWKGNVYAMLVFRKMLPTAAIRTDIARYLDRRCGMGIGI